MNKAPRPYSLDAFPVVLPNYLWVIYHPRCWVSVPCGMVIAWGMPFHLISATPQR